MHTWRKNVVEGESAQMEGEAFVTTESLDVARRTWRRRCFLHGTQNASSRRWGRGHPYIRFRTNCGMHPTSKRVNRYAFLWNRTMRFCLCSTWIIVYDNVVHQTATAAKSPAKRIVAQILMFTLYKQFTSRTLRPTLDKLGRDTLFWGANHQKKTNKQRKVRYAKRVRGEV